MKIMLRAHPSLEKEKALESPPLKVCMHVLGIVRTDQRVLRDATALQEAGFAVSIVDVEEEHTRPAQEDFHGICLQHVLMPGSFFSTRFDRWSFIRAGQLLIHSTLRLIQAPADIYHAHDVSALPACYIAALIRRKPLIFDAHELPLSERPLSEMSRNRQRLHKLLAVLFVNMLRRCAGVITVSPPMVEEMQQRYHIQEITLIRNLPPYRVVPKNDRLRQALGLGPGVRVALYQGNLQPDRNLDLLIRAAPFLAPDIVIVMMGKDMKSTRAQLEALIASEGVSDRVKILPPAPYEELLDWTASADLGLIVYSPDYSGNVQMMLPNKFFEYLMAGLPVLASQLDATAEVIKTYDVGQVISSLDPADIAAAISGMLADRVALDRMHRHALEAARHEFCWEKEREQLLRLYHKIWPPASNKVFSS